MTMAKPFWSKRAEVRGRIRYGRRWEVCPVRLGDSMYHIPDVPLEYMPVFCLLCSSFRVLCVTLIRNSDPSSKDCGFEAHRK